METSKLKEYLLQIADKLTSESTLENVYEQLALLSDIDASKEDERAGRTLTQEKVENLSKSWSRGQSD